MKHPVKQLRDYDFVANPTALAAYSGPLNSITLLSGQQFAYSSSSTRTADGCNVITATGKGGGRWISKYKIFINVLDYGAAGTGSTDDTAAIQAAINYAIALQNPATDGILPIHRGVDCQVYLPYGQYKITSTLSIPGTIRLSGPGTGSYAGAFLVQNTDGISIISLDAATDNQSNASVFERLIFKSGSSTQSSSVAQIISGTANGASNYFRFCWFQSPENYAIWLKKGDDIQICNCTFDVCPFHAIRLGNGSTSGVSNVSITNNTFYDVSLNHIKVDNVKGLIVSINRIYSDSALTGAVFLNTQGASVAKGIVVSVNEYYYLPTFALVSTDCKAISITSNVGISTAGALIQLTGGGILYGANFSNNIVSCDGAFSTAPIDGTGCGLQGSTIIGNTFVAGSTTTNGLNLTDSRVINNTLAPNTFTNFTTTYNITNLASNGIYNQAVYVQGDTAASRTKSIASGNFQAMNLPAGFYAILPAVTGMPFNSSNWTATVEHHEDAAGPGGGTYQTCTVTNLFDPSVSYKGGRDGSGNWLSWSRVHSQGWFKVKETMSPTDGQAMTWNNTNSQWENTTIVNTILTGLSAAGSRTLPTVTDTLLAALGKVLKYLTDLATVAFSGLASDLTGTLAAGQLPAMTGGDVTSSAGSANLTVGSGVVTNAKLANVATATIKGRTSAGTGSPEDLTPAQARSVMGLGTIATLAAPTGTVVGTSDTQTLTNKTVNGVSVATFGFLDPTSSVQTQLNGKQAVDSHGTLTYAATTNLDVNSTNNVQTVSLTGNITFTTSNRAVTRTKVVRIICDSTSRTFTWPTGWTWLGSAAPSSIAASKTAILSVYFFGPNDTDAVASYSVQP